MSRGEGRRGYSGNADRSSRGAGRGSSRGAGRGSSRGADRGADHGADRGADHGADRGALNQDRGRASRGSRRSNGGQGQDQSDFVKVGDMKLTLTASNNEKKILDTIAELIDDGASLQEVLQESGLQLWCRFWFPDDGGMEYRSEDQLLVTFKKPSIKAPKFNLASVSFDSKS